MTPETIQVDVDKFDAWTAGSFRNEKVDFFRCPGCKTVFLGLPDSHACLTNPRDPSRQSPYSLSRKTLCPSCGHMWHDGKSAWSIEPVTDSELSHTDWAWLRKKQKMKREQRRGAYSPPTVGGSRHTPNVRI